jgi:hypothetical protein
MFLNALSGQKKRQYFVLNTCIVTLMFVKKLLNNNRTQVTISALCAIYVDYIKNEIQYCLV